MKCTKGNHPAREQISGQGRALNSVNDQFLQSGAAKTQQILTDTSLMLIGRFDKPTLDRKTNAVIQNRFFEATQACAPAYRCSKEHCPSTGC